MALPSTVKERLQSNIATLEQMYNSEFPLITTSLVGYLRLVVELPEDKSFDWSTLTTIYEYTVELRERADTIFRNTTHNCRFNVLSAAASLEFALSLLMRSVPPNGATIYELWRDPSDQTIYEFTESGWKTWSPNQ
jgi:hypothetical protein